MPRFNTYSIPILPETQVVNEGHDRLIVRNGKGQGLVLVNPIIEKQRNGNYVVLKSRATYKGFKSICRTWSTLIKKLETSLTITYQITPVYRHFPISLRKTGDREVTVYNFLGAKDANGNPQGIPIPILDGVEWELPDIKTLRLRSTNAGILGNNVTYFHNIKYKGIRGKDMRVFTDGFKIVRL